MSVRTCPKHRTPLVTHGELCPGCGGEGTVMRHSQLWESYCDECRGSGLLYSCPDCDREEAAAEEVPEGRRAQHHGDV